MSKREKACRRIIGWGIAQIVSFFLFGLFAEQIQGFDRYYYEETYQNMVKILNIVKYISLFSGLFDVGYGAYLLAKVAEEENNPNLGECPDCQKMVSIHATHCPHCGCKFDAEDGKTTAYSNRTEIIPSAGSNNDVTQKTVSQPRPNWTCKGCGTENSFGFLTCAKCGRSKNL